MLWTKADADFLDHARNVNLQNSYVENPKSVGSASRLRYHRYSRAETFREALELGATVKDMNKGALPRRCRPFSLTERAT